VTTFTLIDEGRVTSVDAAIGDNRVLIEADDLTRATGWMHKPEGLCRGEVCVPVRGAGLEVDGRIDLVVLAETLRRPMALDVTESAAFLGASAHERAEQLGSLRAQDFTLPDLQGRRHSLSDHRGNKVLLVFYASW
jgi:hypothetical protein